jgi:CheY-like chemotaxis protein
MRTETKSILVVEDDRLLQFTMRMQLQRLNCPVEIIDNGIDAVELTQKFAYPLMFLDVHMPGLSGLEVIAAVRKYEATNELTPLVVIGMTADHRKTEDCVLAGMNDCLMKPITLPILQEIISKYLA